MKLYNDIEDVQDALLAILKRDLNTELDALNNSKAVQLDIPVFDDGAYYDNMDKNTCESAFVIYGVESTTPISLGNALQSQVTIAFVACYECAGEHESNRIMMRVQKAIEEVFKKAWRKDIRNDYNIIKTEPLLLSDDSGDYVKASGVMLEVTI